MSNILTNNINARSGNTITIGKAGDTVSIAGTLSYEDVSSVDSVGVITARSGIHVTSGDVGIGTDNPGSILDVRETKTGGSTQVRVYNTDTSNTTTQTAEVSLSPDSRGLAGAGIKVFKENADFSTNAGRDISLALNAVQNNSQTEAVRITSGGDVGIGTDNATRKLHVFGDGDTTSLVAAVAGDALFDISNTGDGNYSGINFTRERSTGSSTGGSVFMPSITANNEATLFIQTQTASAGAGVTSTLSASNGVRLKLSSTPNGVAGNTAFTVEVGNAERMRVNASGNVMIATDSTQGGHNLSVRGDSLSPMVLRRNGTNGGVLSIMKESNFVGSITVNTTSSSFNTTSDYRLKENIINISDGISRVKQLEPKRFNFITDTDTTVDGFLAHEAATVVPEAVTGEYNAVDEDNNPVYQQIDQSKLVPLLTAALKEAITKIETLETKVAALEAN